MPNFVTFHTSNDMAAAVSNKTIKDGDIAPWKDFKKNLTKIKEKNKEITIF